MLLYDLLTDIETEAEAADLGCAIAYVAGAIEALEKTLLLRRWDTQSSIADGADNILTHPPQAKCHLAAIGRVFDRVTHQVVQHPLHPVRIQHGGQFAFPTVQLQLVVGR